MKITFYVFTLLLYMISFGQSPPVNDCVLQTENEIWKTKFINTNTLEEKVKLVIEKVKSDSIYSESKQKISTHCTPTLTNEAVDSTGNKCGCRILFVLNYSKKRSTILNLNSRPEFSHILEKLNIENVEKIFFVFDKRAESLYGTRGKCGFVELTVRDKKLKALIKKLPPKPLNNY